MAQTNTIRFHRERRGTSQEACARDVNVSTATWCNYEHGRTLPDVVTAQRIATVLGVPVDALWPAEKEAS